MLNMPPNLPRELPTAGELDNPDSAQDSAQYFDGKYTHENVPQRLGDPRKHRFLIPYPLGTWSQGNRNGSITAGLAPGQKVTYDVDQRPDLWIISIGGDSDANIRVYLGDDVGGPFFPVGVGGKAKVPAQGGARISIANVGTGTAFGAVVAVAGFPDFDIDFVATETLSSKGVASTFGVVSVTTGGVQVLAANARRKSALFQNLGANQITLGKGSAPVSGSGYLLSGTGNPTFNDTVSLDAWFATAATGATNLLVSEYQ